MKKQIFFLLALVFLAIPCFADKKDRAKMMEEIQNFKIDFLAQEMELTEKVKADFAPLYREYDNELRKTGSEVFKFEREMKKKKDPTDADYKRLSELQKKSREDFETVNKKYEPKFEAILNSKQIYQMHKGEEKFFEKMKEMRKKHGGDSKHKGTPGNPDKKGGHTKKPGDFPPPPQEF